MFRTLRNRLRRPAAEPNAGMSYFNRENKKVYDRLKGTSNIIREYNAFNAEITRTLNAAKRNQLTKVNFTNLNTRYWRIKNGINAEIRSNINASANNNAQIAALQRQDNFRKVKNIWIRETNRKLKQLKTMASTKLYASNRGVDTHLHLFWGLGCHYEYINTTSIKNMASEYGGPNIRTFAHCNPSLGKTLKHLGLQCISPFGPRMSTYIKQQVQYIKTSLENPAIKKVIVIGHSYGGQSVNMVCRELNSHPDAGKLDVTTFGATYIAPPSYLTRIKIKQFMRADDVALHCMRTIIPPVRALMRKPGSSNINALYDPNKQVNNRSTGITWLKPDSGYRALIPTIVGTTRQWRAHGNYDIYNYIRKKVSGIL